MNLRTCSCRIPTSKICNHSILCSFFLVPNYKEKNMFGMNWYFLCNICNHVPHAICYVVISYLLSIYNYYIYTISWQGFLIRCLCEVVQCLLMSPPLKMIPLLRNLKRCFKLYKHAYIISRSKLNTQYYISQSLTDLCKIYKTCLTLCIVEGVNSESVPYIIFISILEMC